MADLAAITGMVKDLEPNEKALAKAANSGYATATDLADWLVRTLNMPFRQAHDVTGRIVAAAEGSRLALDKLPLEEMQAIEPRITAEVFGVLGARSSVKSRTSYGGTAPENVRQQARRWLKKLEREAESAPRSGGKA